MTGTHPPGCATTVETYTSDERRDPADVPPDAWSPSHRVGPQGGGAAAGVDHAVLSPRGRHLVLRIGLCWRRLGDSPTVDRAAGGAGGGRAWIASLPAVYRSDDEDADFLRRFLAMFGTDLDRRGAEPEVAARALLPDRRAGCVAGRAGCRARRAPRARLAPPTSGARCWSPHRAGTGGGARRRR